MSFADDFYVCSRGSCRTHFGHNDLVWEPVVSSPRQSVGTCPKCGSKTYHLEQPLFIPLREEFFNQFERLEKDTEYRLRGARWNAMTCRVGRRVVLSCGYGKRRRLTGTVVGFHYDSAPTKLPAFIKCYGSRGGDAACIKIQLDPK